MGTLTVEMSKVINILFSLCKCKFQVSFSDIKWNYSSHLVLSPGFIWSPSFFYGPSFMYLTCAMPKRLLIITIDPIRWALYAIYYDTYFLWIIPFYSHKDSVILILQTRTLRLKWVPTNLKIWLWQLIWVIPTAVFSGLNMDPKLPSRYFRDGLAQSLTLPSKRHYLHIPDHSSPRTVGRWHICTCGEGRGGRCMGLSPLFSTALFLCSMSYRIAWSNCYPLLTPLPYT